MQDKIIIYLLTLNPLKMYQNSSTWDNSDKPKLHSRIN